MVVVVVVVEIDTGISVARDSFRSSWWSFNESAISLMGQQTYVCTYYRTVFFMYISSICM